MYGVIVACMTNICLCDIRIHLGTRPIFFQFHILVEMQARTLLCLTEFENRPLMLVKLLSAYLAELQETKVWWWTPYVQI